MAEVLQRTSKWRHKISIKDQFEDETTPELIIKLCSLLSKQLQVIIDIEEKRQEIIEEDRMVLSQIEEVKDNFDFLKTLADGTIPESEWDNYSFEGEFKEDFNGYLSQLYDLGDTRVIIQKNVKKYSEKFIWIN